MLARQVVLPLEEEGPGQLQADPHQIGAVDQHSAQRGDGLVQQRLPFVAGKIGLLRCSGCRQADEEEHVRLDLARPWASGRRMPSASSNRPCSIRVRVSATAATADWLAAGGGGGSSSALHAGAESRRAAAAARVRRRGLIVMPATLEGCSRDKKEGGKTCHPLPEV